MNTDIGHLAMLIDAANKSPTSLLDARNRGALFSGILRVLQGQNARLEKLERLLTSKGAPNGNA
jgi:hypothetical protein